MKQKHNSGLVSSLIFGIPCLLFGVFCLFNISSAIRKHDDVGVIFSVLFAILLIPMGIAIIYFAFKSRRDAMARYATIYAKYPELEGDLDLIKQASSLADPVNELYLYEDTLFYARGSLLDIPLTGLNLVGVKIERMQDAPRVSSNHLFLSYMHEGDRDIRFLDLGTVNQTKYDYLVAVLNHLASIKPDLRIDNAVEGQ